MCNHGTKRNRRMGADYTTDEYQTNDGRTVRLTYASHEYSMNDVFCVKCGDWVTAKGVMGAILCPMCCTPWDKCPECEGTNLVPNAWGTGEASGGWADYCDVENPLPVATAATEVQHG